MKLYIILKDGKPYITDRDNKPFVKAYYEESVAKKIAKQFCSSEANTYYNYGDGREQLEQEGYEYPAIMDEMKKRAKQLVGQWSSRWEVKEVEV